MEHDDVHGAEDDGIDAVFKRNEEDDVDNHDVEKEEEGDDNDALSEPMRRFCASPRCRN